jgi:hypothetical protein
VIDCFEDSLSRGKRDTAKKMSRPRIELRTFCVLDRCDNQLRHRPDAKYHLYSDQIALLVEEELLNCQRRSLWRSSRAALTSSFARLFEPCSI